MRHCAIPLGSKSDQSGFIYLFSIKQTLRSNNIIKHLATFIKWMFFYNSFAFLLCKTYGVSEMYLCNFVFFMVVFFYADLGFPCSAELCIHFFSSKTLPKSQSAFSMQTLYHTSVNMYISTPNYLFIFDFYLLFMSSK